MTHRHNSGIRVRRELRKQVAKDYGYSTVIIGEESGEVVIDIDFERLAKRLGNKAIGSKGKKATAMLGAIEVRLVNYKRETFGEKK